MASAQTIGSAFLEWVRKVQNSKQKPDLLKTIDCLIDGSGFVNGDHVIFSKKNWKTFDNICVFSQMLTKLTEEKKNFSF